MHDFMDVWLLHVCNDVWMYVCIDVWMYECIDVCKML